VNYAFGALWGTWLLFWLAFARGNKRRHVKAIIPFLY